MADFWNLMFHHEMAGIVLLGSPQQLYWPSETGSHNTIKGIQVALTSETRLTDDKIIVRDFSITDLQSQVVKSIRQWQIMNIDSYEAFLKNSMYILEVCDLINTWQLNPSHNLPITVQCRNGVGLSGMFVGLSMVLEKMRIDRHVDIVFAVKQLRLSRTNSFQIFEQYIIIHQIVQRAIIENHDVYYNITSDS